MKAERLKTKIDQLLKDRPGFVNGQDIIELICEHFAGSKFIWWSKVDLFGELRGTKDRDEY